MRVAPLSRFRRRGMAQRRPRDRDVQGWLESIAGMPQALGALVLLAAALIEYVFPPFPGDAICLFGAFLVGRAGWSLPLVFGAVLVGSLVGLSLDYWFGVFLRRRLDRRRAGAPASRRIDALMRLEPRFRDHATATLVVNRFLPGIRALLFVGAGFFGVSYGKALALGAASALVWNALIFFAGVALGASWGDLSSIVSSYTTVVWIVLALVVAVLLVRWRLRRSRPR